MTKIIPAEQGRYLCMPLGFDPFQEKERDYITVFPPKPVIAWKIYEDDIRPISVLKEHGKCENDLYAIYDNSLKGIVTNKHGMLFSNRDIIHAMKTYLKVIDDAETGYISIPNQLRSYKS